MCKVIKVAGRNPGTSAYLYQGYRYSLDKRGKKRIYRCSTKSAGKCKGILYYDKNNVLCTTKHSHKPEVLLIEKQKLIKEMTSMAENTHRHTKSIFDEVCRRNPNVGKHLSYRQLRSRLEKARAKLRPNLPQSLLELHQILVDYKPLKGFYQGIIRSKKFYGLMFSSAALLAALGKAHQLFIDGTFSVVPTVPSMMQLYSIHIRIMDAGVVTVFVLTEKRTTGLYKAMWSKLFEMVPTLQANVTHIMSDYEKAAMAAARASFPNSRQHGCWFHYCQALLRRWKKLGLAKCQRDILLMGMTLPLAPASRFGEGLALMQVKAELIAGLFPAIENFMAYLNQTWAPIADKVSVNGMAVRTNNVVESFHSTAKEKLGGVHPNLWIFLEKLKELILDFEIKLARIEENVDVDRPKPAKRQDREVLIMKMQDDLTSGTMSLQEFLQSLYEVHQKILDGSEDDMVPVDEVDSEEIDGCLFEVYGEENDVEVEGMQDQMRQHRQGWCNQCNNMQSTVVFTACGHVCLCSDCSAKYKLEACPSCRKPSTRITIKYT